MPLLAKAAVDQELSWQQRLTARICYERIQRGDDIEALRRYDWREHPDFNVEWQRSMVGPGYKMYDLVVSRLVELGLWYYYIELTWKQTQEWTLAEIYRVSLSWNYWCRCAVTGQPEEMFLWLAIEERLDGDVAMEAYDVCGLYEYTRKTKQPNSVPLLVRKYDAFFKKEIPGRERYPGRYAELHSQMFGPVLSFANASHADMLEKYIEEHPDMAVLKLKLEEVRARPPHTPPREPPFRLGTMSVKIP